jgi:hypothetical protein
MLMRGLIAWRFKHPLATSILLHPVGIGYMIAIGINSYRTVKRGAIQWKDRAIAIKMSERNEGF